MTKENQCLIDAALAKLTEEEKILLGLAKDPNSKYNLTIYYMIGDADGNHFEIASISQNNPFLPYITKILDAFDINIKGTFRRFDDKTFDDLFIDGHIEPRERKLIRSIVDEDYDSTREIFKLYDIEDNDDNCNFIAEFDGLIRDEIGAGRISFRYYDLK